MSSFTEDLYVRKISARNWEVTRQFEYHVGKEDSGEVVVVDKGFITDFASVPRAFWVIFPPDGRYTQAAVLHDKLCKSRQYSRIKTNRIFLEAMEVLKVPKWRRTIMYMAVSGWTYFNWKAVAALCLLLCLGSCTTLKATQGPGFIKLTGFSGGKATFSNGDKIEKDGWKMPDLPIRMTP